MVSVPKSSLVKCRSLNFMFVLDLRIVLCGILTANQCVSVHQFPDLTFLYSRVITTMHGASLNFQGLRLQFVALSLTASLWALFLPGSVPCAMFSEDTLPLTKGSIYMNKINGNVKFLLSLTQPRPLEKT